MRRTMAALIVLLALTMMAPASRAQEMSPPMPDPSYAAPPAVGDGGAAAGPEQAPDPTGAIDDPGTGVAVPIPGGGEVQAQGPDGQAVGQQIPPTETWGASRISPNGSGTGPLGP
jgi:hypothetical protein